MKKVLKCTCQDCGKEFEVYADYLIPGVEGFMNLAEGRVLIMDPTRTDRMCDECVAAALEKLTVDDGGDLIESLYI